MNTNVRNTVSNWVEKFLIWYISGTITLGLTGGGIFCKVMYSMIKENHDEMILARQERKDDRRDIDRHELLIGNLQKTIK